MEMEQDLKIMLYIYNRLKEPSTHAALTGLFATFGGSISDSTWNTVMNVLAIIFAIAGILLKETKPEMDNQNIGDNTMSFFNSVKSAFAGLGKYAPMMTTVATTVEVATGHADLVNLTQKAGAAAVKVGEEVNTSGDVIGAVAEQVSVVAATEGEAKIADIAGKVSAVAKKVKK